MKPNPLKKDVMMILRTRGSGIFGCLLIVTALVISTPVFAGVPDDGTVLPFPPTPSASVAGPTLQESKHAARVSETSHLPKDAPNILIIMLDDVGFGLAETYGGPIRTPTLSAASPMRASATMHSTPPRSARRRGRRC